ncbi:MAG: PQQ-binding-like beta-propeller repeat protein [Planctomycetota bacterium]
MRLPRSCAAPITPTRSAVQSAWGAGVLALTVTVALLLPGCASSDGSWGGSSPQTPTSTSPQAIAGGDLDPTLLREMGLTVRWIYDLELASRTGITDLEVLEDLVVAVEGPDNFITAIDADAGTYQWKTLIGLDLESLYRPLRTGDGSLGGDRIFVNSAARFFTLDPGTGRLTGVQSLEAPVTAGAELIGDLAVFGAAKGMAFAHDVDAGYAKWRYRMTGRLVSPPVRANETTVFLGDEAGTYVMLDVGSGDPVFRNDVFGPIVAPAAVHRGDLLVPSADRTLYALDRATGNESWAYRADSPLRDSPLSVGRDIYLPASGGGLIALDSRGQVRWESSLNATPVLASDEGILALGTNALLLFDPDTGKVKQSVKAAGLAAATPAANGSLILRMNSGRLVRLDPN